MAKRPEAPAFTSFKGIFVFPKLSEPDYGSKDYPKPDGEFTLKLRGKSDDADVKAMMAKLQPYYDAAIANAKEEFKALKVESRKKLEQKNGKGGLQINPFFTTVFDPETEEETGEVDFKFSMPYSGVFKKGPKEGQTWYRAPDIFDAKGNKLPYFTKDRKTGVIKPVTGAPGIWGGTVGRIAFELGINKEGQPGYFIPGTGAAGLSLKLKAVRIISLVSGGQRSASDYGFEDEEGDDLSSQFGGNDTTTEADDTADTSSTEKSETSSNDDNTDF